MTALMGVEVVYNQGRPITDLLGNPRVTPDGKRQVDTQVFPAEYALGKKWSTRIGITRPGGFTEEVRLDLAVTARETIEVLAGRFEAFRIEASGWGMKTGKREFRYWMAPDRVRRILLREQRTWDTRRDANAAPEQTRIELVSFSEAGRAAPPSPRS